MSQRLLLMGRDLNSRELFFLQISSWDDWPHELELPSKHFCLLLAGDAQGVSEESIGSVAEQALTGGCVYLCAWGPDCERVHDWFDVKFEQRNIADATPNAPVVITTWHEKETLDSALTFLTRDAVPDDAFAATCRSSLVVVVGNSEWAAVVRRRFA